MFKLREESRLEAEMLTDELKEQLANDYKQLEDDIEQWKEEERQKEENEKEATKRSKCWILLFTYSVLSVIYMAFLKPDGSVFVGIDALLVILSALGCVGMAIILLSVVIAILAVIREETWKIKYQQRSDVD